MKAKVLRHVSPAFQEDPVRILRLARFYARFYSMGFTIANETYELVRHMVAKGEVEALIPERVWQECSKALHEKNPEQFFLALRLGGALEKVFPELHALFGVPQKPSSHPEIDCGVHTLMVLKQAAQLCEHPEVRFAALCHDFGKALVPMSDWPSMHQHENLGLQTVKKFCSRLKVPSSYSRMALLVAQFHGFIHDGLSLKAKMVVDILQKTDAFRRPERFAQLLMACEADSRGRIGFEDAEYPQRKFWQKMLDKAKSVDIQTFIKQGLKGIHLAEAIRHERIKVVDQEI